MVASSILVAVSFEQAKDVSPPKYWLFTVSRAVMPNSSDIPRRVIMALASLVACSISLLAPLVMELKINSSAQRPPVYTMIFWKASSFDNKFCSFSSTCIVYPKAPFVRGIIVIL